MAVVFANSFTVMFFQYSIVLVLASVGSQTPDSQTNYVLNQLSLPNSNLFIHLFSFSINIYSRPLAPDNIIHR
jgi:hypothetical protein